MTYWFVNWYCENKEEGMSVVVLKSSHFDFKESLKLIKETADLGEQRVVIRNFFKISKKTAEGGF